MKSVFAVLALSIATTAMASDSFTCKTAPNKFNGLTAITVTETDAYDAVIKGTVSGGIAHFIREILPTNVKVTREADMMIYENSEEGMKLTLVTTPIAGRVLTTATYQEGTEFPALQMSCQ